MNENNKGRKLELPPIIYVDKTSIPAPTPKKEISIFFVLGRGPLGEDVIRSVRVYMDGRVVVEDIASYRVINFSGDEFQGLRSKKLRRLEVGTEIPEAEEDLTRQPKPKL